MKSRNTRVLVFATALLTAPLLPAWGQGPVHPRPQPKKQPKAPQVIVTETPIEAGDPQQQGTPQDQGAPQQMAFHSQDQTAPPPQSTPPEQTPPPAQGTAPQTPPEQGATPPAAPAGPKIVKPEEIGSFAPPQGWQQGDPTKMALSGDPCCVWTPDNVASIVAFVQRPGKPLKPKVLLEQSAQALQSAFGAEVKTKEVTDIGGMK